MDKTIIQLQEAIAHQSADISHLSDELYAQQKELAALRQQMDALNAKLKTMAEDQGDAQAHGDEPPPPHY